MANYAIENLEGIDPGIAEKFRACGVTTTDKLLEACKTLKDRKALETQSGIDGKAILRFANMVDLFRIKGVGKEYADLLEASGVDTVPELSRRKADNLHAKMVEVNEAQNLCRRVPTLKDVEAWIEEAKTLPRVLEY